MKILILLVAAFVLCAQPAKGVKEYPGFDYIGSWASGSSSGIGIQAIGNYYQSQNMAGWELAFTTCKNLSPGMSSLLSVETQDEDAHVQDNMVNRGVGTIWTSGYGEGGRVKWGGTGALDYRPFFPWRNGGFPPNGNDLSYAIVANRGARGDFFYDVSHITNQFFYICEIRAGD